MALAELMQEKLVGGANWGLCELTNEGRILKETGAKTELSDRGWIEVLQQWTVWEKNDVFVEHLSSSLCKMGIAYCQSNHQQLLTSAAVS